MTGRWKDWWGEYIEEGVSDALQGIFSYGGAGRKLIEKKISGVIIPAIERQDFNRYLIKLDAVLAEIVGMTSLADNKALLEKFRWLMAEPERKEIRLSEVFGEYCRHVAANVCTESLEPCPGDGEPYYGHVTARMEARHEDKSWLESSFDDCAVRFSCDEDRSLNCQVRLYRRAGGENWNIRGNGDAIDINSLRGLSNFEVFLMSLKRGSVDIIMDRESICNDDIEPDERPEWIFG